MKTLFVILLAILFYMYIMSRDEIRPGVINKTTKPKIIKERRVW